MNAQKPQKTSKNKKAVMVENQDLITSTIKVAIRFADGRVKIGSPLALIANKKLIAALPEAYATRLGFLAGVEYSAKQRQTKKK